MVGTKSRGYSNSGRFSEGEFSMLFFFEPVTALFSSDRLLGLYLTFPDLYQYPRSLKIF